MPRVPRLVTVTLCALMLGAPGASAQRHGGGARGPAAGGHTITLYLDGYQTFQRSVYVSLGHHASIRHTMEPLSPGARSEPPVTTPPAADDD